MEYADAMRQGAITGAVDSNGWPLSATFTAAGANGRYTDGRWTVYFDGTATATITGGTTDGTIHGPGGTGPDNLPLGPNTRWLQFNVTNAARNDVLVTFRTASRNDGSGLPGLTNIRLMRPVSQGSTTSHPRSETVHRQVKSLVQRFGTVRYMDFLATNWNQTTTWGSYPWQPGRAYQVGNVVTTCKSSDVTGRSCAKVFRCTVGGTSGTNAGAQPDTAIWNGTVTDGTVTWQWVGWGRPLPTWSGFDRNEGTGSGIFAPSGADFGWQGSGGPYEDVIRFANETGTDAWITLPVQVDDDYLTKVAQLFAFGSDGAMPYTSPRGDPVYPPLDPSLNLYIEFGNEVWNLDFSQARWLDSVAQPDGVLDYNGDTVNLQYRYVGRKVARIANAFRAAFGDSQMPYTGNGRIRPVIVGQGANPDQTNGIALKWIHEFLGDGDGRDHSAARSAAGFSSTAYPIRYYAWGTGGAPYWDASGATDPVSVLNAMNITRIHADYLARMNRHAAIYGLPLIAYEGGPEVPQNAIGTLANMLDRPAAPNMRDVLIANHDNWSKSGGNLFVYFTLSLDPRWCFVGDDGFRGNIFLDSPKLRAIDELMGGSAAPVSLSADGFQNGTAIPGVALGGAYTLWYQDGTYAPPSSGSGSLTLRGSNAWQNTGAYVFLASDSGTYSIGANLSGGGSVSCFLDGVKLGAAQTATGQVNFGTVSLGPGLHGVILVASTGSVTITSVSLNATN